MPYSFFGGGGVGGSRARVGRPRRDRQKIKAARKAARSR